MGKFEKPLTWVLIIVLLGYLFATNFGSENNSSFTIKDPKMGAAPIETSSHNLLESEPYKKEIMLEVQLKDDSLNVDSIIEAALKDIDMKGNIDSLIRINLEEENTEE